MEKLYFGTFFSWKSGILGWKSGILGWKSGILGFGCFCKVFIISSLNHAIFPIRYI